MELGNLVAVALVFGQLVSQKPFSLCGLAVGSVLTIACYLVAYMVD